MDTKLKPCPLCKGEVTLADMGDYWIITRASGMPTKKMCSCRLFMESGLFYDEESKQREKEKLIERWNTRPTLWETGTPTESGKYAVHLKYDFGKDGYSTAEYVEPFNPHTGWYNLYPPAEVDGHEWARRKDIEVVAWVKIDICKDEEDNT